MSGARDPPCPKHSGPSNVPNGWMNVHVENPTGSPLPEAEDDQCYLLLDEPYYHERSFHLKQLAVQLMKQVCSAPAHKQAVASSQQTESGAATSIGFPKPSDLPSPSSDGLNADDYQLCAPWGTRFLLAEIDRSVEPVRRKELKAVLNDARPRRSKWTHPTRMGQDQLYDALEKVLVELKAFTPHSLPFLNRVNRKEVADYYEIIKKPMDLGTMSKRLKSLSYNNKAQFAADLNLIHDNCLRYNCQPDSVFRQHAVVLKEKADLLMKSVPDITIQSRDDLDSIIEAQLDLSSDEEFSSASNSPIPSSKNDMPDHQAGEGLKSTVRSSLDHSKREEYAEAPCRSSLGMACYREHQILRATGSESVSPFFPEITYPFDTLPDAKRIGYEGRKIMPIIVAEEAISPFRVNIELLRQIRLRNRQLQKSPQSNCTGKPEALDVQLEYYSAIDSERTARSCIRKILALFVTAAGFETISSEALQALIDVIIDYAYGLLRDLRGYLDAHSRSMNMQTILEKVLRENGIGKTSRLFDFIKDHGQRQRRRLERIVEVVLARVEEASKEEVEGNTGAEESLVEDDSNDIGGNLEDDPALDIYGLREMGIPIGHSTFTKSAKRKHPTLAVKTKDSPDSPMEAWPPRSRFDEQIGYKRFDMVRSTEINGNSSAEPVDANLLATPMKRESCSETSLPSPKRART